MHLNATVVGLGAGMALGFAGAFGGIVAFIIVLVVGAAGLGVGIWIDRSGDVSDVLDRGRELSRGRGRDRAGR
jgi:uncharacterized membrane protein